MRPTATPYIAFLYGVIVIWLGYLGWRNVGSVASFVMGGGFGLLTLIGSLFMIQGRKWADWATLVCVAVLMVSFGIRFYATHSFMPAVMGLFSALLVVLILIKIFRKQLTER